MASFGRQDDTCSLGALAQRIAEDAYTRLAALVRSEAADARQRRAALKAHLQRVRDRLQRLLLLARWAQGSGYGCAKAAKELSSLRAEAEGLVEGPERLWMALAETQATRELPFGDIPTALDVLNRGTYSRLPSCLAKELAPQFYGDRQLAKEELDERISDCIREKLLSERLDISQTVSRVSNGSAALESEGEYWAQLHLEGDDLVSWRCTTCGLGIAEEGRRAHSRSVTFSEWQAQVLSQRITSAMQTSETPLLLLHSILQEVAGRVAVNRLAAQAHALAEGRWRGALYVAPLPGAPPPPGASLSFWLPRDGPLSEETPSISIELGEQGQACVRDFSHSHAEGSGGANGKGARHGETSRFSVLSKDAMKSLSVERLLLQAGRDRAGVMLGSLAAGVESDGFHVEQHECELRIGFRRVGSVTLAIDPASGEVLLSQCWEYVPRRHEERVREMARSALSSRQTAEELFLWLERLAEADAIARSARDVGFEPLASPSSSLNGLSHSADAVFHAPCAGGRAFVACACGREPRMSVAVASDFGAGTPEVIEEIPLADGGKHDGLEALCRMVAPVARILSLEAELRRRGIRFERVTGGGTASLKFSLALNGGCIPARVTADESANCTAAAGLPPRARGRLPKVRFNARAQLDASGKETVLVFPPTIRRAACIVDDLAAAVAAFLL